MEEKSLESTKIGNKVLYLIYLYIGLSLILSAGDVIEVLKNDLFLKMETSFSILWLILGVVIIAMIIITPIWIYKTHKDLCTVFPEYPISPKKSLAMTLIPFYNLWGLWKMAKSMFDIFLLEGINLKWFGIRLQGLYIFCYVFGAIDRRMLQMSMKPSYNEFTETGKLIFQISWAIVTVILPILWYGIVSLVQKGMSELNKKGVIEKHQTA